MIPLSSTSTLEMLPARQSSGLLDLLSWYHSACAQATLSLLNDSPKVQESNAGNLNMPRRAIKYVHIGQDILYTGSGTNNALFNYKIIIK